MKLDILAFGAHPDDVELACAGTMILHQQSGLRTGIVDLTRGEMGTRGSEIIRESEAIRATEILGLSLRENLRLPDGFIQNDRESRLAVVKCIREYMPDIILCNAITDRHPDHGSASNLVSDAIFLAGLPKVITESSDGLVQSPWKVRKVYHYIQDRYIKPDFVIDVSSVWGKRMDAVMAFSSQFYNPVSSEPSTAISSKEFLDFLSARAQELGRQAGFAYAEGFTVERTPGLKSLSDLI
ncbi:MAG: bacillithiol biosynthesis deacetylase BshB1 [Bacteroidetes bacterium]|nr:MAG: bacillithiol biosynthesis deacetylase BshB1 [Bacteroidota bacterium]